MIANGFDLGIYVIKQVVRYPHNCLLRIALALLHVDIEVNGKE